MIACISGTVSVTPEEEAIIVFVEKDKGRKLTAQETFLALEQARAIGEL
jgi:hypothetical protein